jgi:hypothetical protein
MFDLKRRAAQVWASRAVAEAQAAARFDQIADDLHATNAPAVLVELSRAAAAEERTHVEFCLELVEHFGHQAPRPTVPSLSSSVNDFTASDSLLLQIVGMCCINETISAAILSEMLRNAETGMVHDTIQKILRDEISHSRIGWGYLQFIQSKHAAALISKHLPGLLSNAVNDELFEQPDINDPDLKVAPYGAVPRVTRFEFFGAALRDLVFPGLERFDVDVSAGQRWLTSMTSGRA